MKGYWF